MPKRRYTKIRSWPVTFHFHQALLNSSEQSSPKTIWLFLHLESWGSFTLGFSQTKAAPSSNSTSPNSRASRRLQYSPSPYRHMIVTTFHPK
jgi:hypothetical protein